MSVTEPLFGFDWRRVGPLELIARGRRRLGRAPIWVKALLAIALATVAGLAWYYNVGVPVWAWLVAFCMLAGAAIAVAPSKGIVDELSSDNHELLEELKPVEGDRATRKISQDRWADLTVIDHAGRVKDRSYLTEVTRLVKDDEDGREYRTAYEVDCYWPDANVALASYMAGASNADLRRYERAVYLVKETLSEEADRSLEEIVQAPEARRKAASSAVNSVIRAAEGVEAPGEASIVDELGDLRQEAEENVDKMLSDRGFDDLEGRLQKSETTEKDPESVAIAIDDATDNATNEDNNDE